MSTSADDDLSLDYIIRTGRGKHAHESDLDLHTAKAASEAALRRVMEFEATSNLLGRPEDSRGVTRLDWDDIRVEGLLGVGGFACVSKVSVPILEDEDPADELFDESERKSTTSGTSGKSANAGCYALKCLNERTTMCESTFISGAADLALEFLLLSNLRHENIVRIYGVSNLELSLAFEQSGGYFLLLELLRGTVSDLLRLWREDLKESAKDSSIPSALDRLKGIALGVAKGMEYLHQNNIVFRDLKPHNIGFDRTGNPRIFDFGLAREVNVSSSTIGHSVPGVAGSWRYMAPECALGNGCVLASDVFSYGVLLWELLSLVKPHTHINGLDEYKQKVANRGIRPNIAVIPTQALKDLLKDSWEPLPSARPSFTDVCKILETTMVNDVDELQQAQKRSWKQQFSALKKSMRTRLSERRRSNGD
eukprot:Nitzschia sp. Nitz4//scaffold45_size130396//28382//29650//NITZ4_003436-RA/size130396-processed-gene-0.177-mRNA-1//1//CDS//3329552359//8987//frame0